MVIIEYSPDGKAIADAHAEQFVLDLVEQNDNDCLSQKLLVCPDLNVKVSTANVIFVSRCLIKEKGYRFQYKFNDEIFEANKDGRLAYYPDGFADDIDDWLNRLL